MIKVKRGAAPKVLVAPDGLADKENKKALVHYADPVKRGTSFKFKVYKHDNVKETLNGLFHFKCAYCESKFGHTAPVDVEHFRPKSAVKRADGTLIKPGYYWLPAKWDNLLPSCIDCNRARIHEHVGENDPELSGKANLFPIENDQRSDLDPDDEKNETRLLLHPCRDTVEEFFKYLTDTPGVIVKPAPTRGLRRRKAEQSIAVYGLNRILLAGARADQFMRVRNQVHLVKSCLELLGQDPDSDKRQQDLALAICELKSLEADEAAHAGMTRFFIRAALSALDAKIEVALGDRLDAFNGDTITARLLDKFPCSGAVLSPDDGDLADLFG